MISGTLRPPSLDRQEGTRRGTLTEDQGRGVAVVGRVPTVTPDVKKERKRKKRNEEEKMKREEAETRGRRWFSQYVSAGPEALVLYGARTRDRKLRRSTEQRVRHSAVFARSFPLSQFFFIPVYRWEGLSNGTAKCEASETKTEVC